MKSIFNLDSPLIRGLGKIADLMILNLLYLISCIPIITIGAANAALYDVTTRLAKDEALIWRHYWQAFRSNFKKATIIWMIFLVSGAVLYGCAALYWSFDLPNKAISLFLLGIAAVAWMCIFSWVFILQARFENSLRNTLHNALLCSFSYLPRTVLMALLNAVFPIVVLLLPAVLFNAIFVLLIIWFSGIAYLNTLLLRKTMKQLEEMADE